jgi:hypothetical protein
MNPAYPQVAERAGGRWEYCLAPQRAFNFAFDVEHIEPAAAGGVDDLDNFALSCRSCNAFKGARLVGADPETSKTVALFHPRLQVWSEHFAFSESGDLLAGITPIGRATVATLQMNSVEQQIARRQWKRLGFFPAYPPRRSTSS